MDTFNKLILVSDGTPNGSLVTDQDGKMIEGITKVVVVIEACKPPKAIITIEDFESRVDIPVKEVTYKQLT